MYTKYLKVGLITVEAAAGIAFLPTGIVMESMPIIVIGSFFIFSSCVTLTASAIYGSYNDGFSKKTTLNCNDAAVQPLLSSDVEKANANAVSMLQANRQQNRCVIL